MKIIFLIISGFFSFFTARASVDSLWKEYREGKNPQQVAPYILDNYANTDNGTKIDSVFSALSGDETSRNNNELFLLYKKYFSYSIFINKQFSIQKAKAWVKLTEHQRDINQAYQAYHNLTKVLFYFDEKKEACNSAEKEYHFAGLSDNKTFKIEALFDKARCFENENNKSEAFKSYLDAYYISLEIKNRLLIQQSVQLISDFFVSNKLYTKAQKYKKQELALFLRNNRNCDSNKYYALLSELSDNYFDNNEVQEATLYSNQVLNYCTRKGNRALLIKQLAVIRSNYFENNNFNGLLELYRVRFPSELDSLKKHNEVAYYRIRSLVFERNGQLGTAISYLDSAEEKLKTSSKDALMRSNFYNRKGEFFLRQNMPQEAVESLLKSYEISYQEKYYPFLKSIAHNLDSAYEQLGD